MFDLPLALHLLVLAFLDSYLVIAGLFNVTIDDQDSRISYSPGWNRTTSFTSLDCGGFHHLSDQSSASAVFNFTGVAIYFISPLWPHTVGVSLVLDHLPPAFVDLRDYSQPMSSGGPETVDSAVVWKADSLELGEHTLRVEFAQGYVVLDALIYTSDDTTSTIPTPVSSSAAGPPMSIAVRAMSSSSNTPVILGAVLGVLVGLMGILSTIIIVNYRHQIAARFPRLFVPRPDVEHQDRRSILSSSFTHSNEHTVITTSTTPVRPPPRLASLPSISKSTITTVTSPSTQTSRPPLPPLNTKQLPPTPDEEGPPSALRKGRSMLSAVSRRFTPAVVPIPQSTSTASATSSFFPKPLYEDDRGMVSRHHSLGSSRTPTPSQSNVPDLPKRLGSYPGVLERGGLFPVKPIRPEESKSDVSTDTPNTDTEKNSHPLSPSISPSSFKRKGMAPLKIIPESNRPRNTIHSKEEKKPVVPLTIIPESNASRISVHSKEESGSPTGKRLSGGKSRREKDKQRRPRHSKMPMTPLGPRPLPTPTTAYGSPLPSATFRTSTDLSSPRSPGSRKRRPLPQASSRSSVHVPPGSLNLAPTNSMPRDIEISSVHSGPHNVAPPPRDIPVVHPEPHNLASPNSMPRDIQPRHHDLGLSPRDISSARQGTHDMVSPPRDIPSAAAQSPQSSAPLTQSDSSRSTPRALASGNSDLSDRIEISEISPSPSLEWTPPSLPPLPSMVPLSSLLQMPIRPRTGQPEYSLSLPSSLPSHHYPGLSSLPSSLPTSSASRGPLPSAPTPALTPTSAPTPITGPHTPETAFTPTSSKSSQETGNKSPRSPRRLPPSPLQLERTKTENLPSVEYPKEVAEAQYLTIPGDLSTAPPPYSGHRLGTPSKRPGSKIPIRTPTQRRLAREGQKDPQASGSIARGTTQSIPVTPSEWRTSSAAISTSSFSGTNSIDKPPDVNDLDDTAALMLFELLDASSSPSRSSIGSVQPLPVRPAPLSRPLPVPHPSRQAIPKTPYPALSTFPMSRNMHSVENPRTGTASIVHQGDEIPLAIPIPKIPTIPEEGVPSPRTPKLPPSPRLIIPPHPATPPPPTPSSSLSVRSLGTRSKVWNTQGLNTRTMAKTPLSNNEDYTKAP